MCLYIRNSHRTCGCTTFSIIRQCNTAKRNSYNCLLRPGDQVPLTYGDGRCGFCQESYEEDHVDYLEMTQRREVKRAEKVAALKKAYKLKVKKQKEGESKIKSKKEKRKEKKRNVENGVKREENETKIKSAYMKSTEEQGTPVREESVVERGRQRSLSSKAKPKKDRKVINRHGPIRF